MERERERQIPNKTIERGTPAKESQERMREYRSAGRVTTPRNHQTRPISIDFDLCMRGILLADIQGKARQR